MTITKINGAKKAVYRGICTTEASAQVKDVTISDAEWTLSEGSVIAVKFQYTNSYSATAANPCKLDVNDTGAKSIYYDDTDEVTGTNQFAFGYEDRVVYYMYDGTNWVFMSCSTMGVEPDHYRPAAGQILPYAGSTAPNGYLMCDGTAYSRTEYSELFAVIGTTYGTGDGSTTFNVPDLRGRTTIGASATHALGTTGGSEQKSYTPAGTVGNHTLTINEIPSHQHRTGIQGNTAGNYNSGGSSAYVYFDQTTGVLTTATGGGQAHSHGFTGTTATIDAMQPYAVANYIISTGKLVYATIKGDTGPQGPQGIQGDAAGFGTPTATVDSNVGTPSVTVTASGPDTAKEFHFEFENLKGDPLTVEDFLPIEAGMIYPYAGSTAPAGYLMCDGTAYLRSEYPELFAVIGTTYGAGDGSTTFNVPDLRGRTLVGSNANHALGTTGGSETVTLTTAQMPNHTHTVGAHKHTVPEHGHGFTQPTVNGGATTTGNGGSHRHNFQANYARAGWSGTSPGGYVTTEKTSVFGSQYSWKEKVKTNTDDGTEIVKSGGDHNHSQVAHTHSVSGGAVSNRAAFDTNNSTAFDSGSNGSDGAHDNMQPYAVTNYIISTGSQYVGFKGEKGDKGNTGDAAGFGTPTATVDSNVGTPSVTVTASGPDTAKVFSFEFENLKGETGDKGDKGEPLTIEDFLPIEAGMIYPYAGSTAPTGYLLCDGTAYLRADYPELFAAIGTTYGAGDGSTTFNVPDLRGRTVIGANASHALGSTGGAETHTLTESQLPKISGSHGDAVMSNHQDYCSGCITPDRYKTGENTPLLTMNSGGTLYGWGISFGGDQPHNNMQPYAVTNYVISTGSQYLGFKGEKGDKGDTGDATDLIHVSTTQPASDSTAIIWFNPVDGAFKAKRNVSGTWVWKELAFVDDSNAA